MRLPQHLELAVAALALTSILTQEVRGAYFPAYNLRSLVTISKCIVLAREVSSRSLGRSGSTGRSLDFKTLVVEKVYKGPLLPGMEVSVFDSYTRSSALGTALSFDPEVILFLEDSNTPLYSPSFQSSVGRPTHGIIVSGLRLLRDKEVYDFIQVWNPGDAFPHLLRQLSNDAEEGNGASNEGPPVTLEAYEKQVLQEIRVVEAVRAALSKSQEPRFRDTLLRIIEKDYLRAAAWRRKHRAVGSGIIEKNLEPLYSQVVDRLRAAGDIEGVLEVMQRTDLYRSQIDAKLLLDAAVRQSLPTRLRVTALLALEPLGIFELMSHTEELSRVAELVGDRDSEVRRTALERLQYAHGRYAEHSSHYGEELLGFWDKLLARIPELNDLEPQPDAKNEEGEPSK